MKSQSQQHATAGSLREPGPRAEIRLWPDRLQRIIDQHCKLLKRIIVLGETDSTQDAARRMNCKPGDIITAWRQTSGRGRLGRVWADTGEDGVAVTFALNRNNYAPEQLAIASAIGTAHAIEAILNKQIGIKWPNDIMVNNRKIAGILIEQADDLALIGIGINVQQRQFPAEIANRAASLLQLGVDTDRLPVLEQLLVALDQSLQLDSSALVDEFTKRDVLRGTNAMFTNRGKPIVGEVLMIDPLRGLSIRTNHGDVRIDAATTSVIPDAKPESHPTSSTR